MQAPRRDAVTPTDGTAWLAIIGLGLIAFALAGYVIDRLDDWFNGKGPNQ